LERAQQRLAAEKKQEAVDYTRAKAALERAMYRLRLAETRRQQPAR